jgi:membrane protease YdiL (CAAX protease family)
METKPLSVNTLLLSAAALIAIELIAGYVISLDILPSTIGLGVARVLQILTMVIVIRKLETGLDAVGISKAALARGLKKGALWSLCFGFASGLIIGLFWLLGRDVMQLFQQPLPDNHKELIFYLFTGIILGPAAEELFFRGLLFGCFRKFGFIPALIISTLLFTLPHIAGSSLPITQITGGLLFAIAYEVEKNLIVPGVIHCLGNLAIFSLAFMN